VAIQSASAVTSSSVSTGAARIESYVRWNWHLRNVPNMAGRALENNTAVATVPVPTKSFLPSTPRIKMLVPVRGVRSPDAPASASTSASRAGGP
jgi:hypothetical protein